MQTTKCIALMPIIVAGLVLGGMQAASADSSDGLVLKVSFPGAKAEGYKSVDKVTATLQMPEGTKNKVPAVIILHGSGGIDGRGNFYAEELNKNGIATLEVYMFTKGGRPRGGTKKTFTHAYGALRYLAERPDIDPKAIGVMGFSWGGVMSLRMASTFLTEVFMADTAGLRFAAHAPFYPLCWAHLRSANDPQDPQYKALTGLPVLIFAGGKDDYDSSPEDCSKFLAVLPESTRSHVALQFYPDATHKWDSQGHRTEFRDRFAHGGKGGWVNIKPDRKIAKDSRMKVVEFFSRTLKTAQ